MQRPVQPAPLGVSIRSVEARARAHPARRAAPEKGATPAEDPRGQLHDFDPRCPRSRSGAEAHQLGRGRAGERHAQGTSLGGGDPSSPTRRHGRFPVAARRNPGNPSRRRPEAT
ncbi:hypothetical protein NDU88_003745 [Pleurodeles waltl]|uniref:Uncharacterized protein n=1 Tax=Pleurodeles waltl TaxID=8319 RepID=A0AAV7VHZ8_PLEWA|nr:hypothetical protein NDU88_003745 [Pleurodeles waltl]